MSTAFERTFDATMRRHAKGILEEEIAWVVSKDGFATSEDRERARKIVERVEAEGKLFDLLEVTAGEPCPECGQ